MERKNHIDGISSINVIRERFAATVIAEATLTATYLSNRPSTRSDEKSAYELWFGHEQELNHLCIFGSWAYDYVPDSQTIKLQKKAKKLLMYRYDSNILLSTR